MASAIGLEISSLCVRIARVSSSKGGMDLELLAEEPLQPGAVVGGEVREPQAVTAAVGALWARAGVKNKRVVLGLAGSGVAVRNTSIGWTPANEIQTTLAFQVGDILPFDVEDAVLDFVPTAELSDQNGDRQYRGLLVGARLVFVEGAVDAVQAAGLTVVAVDLTALAVLRAAVGGAPGGPTPPVAVVNICSNMTQVVVEVGGRPELVRGLSVGSEAAVVEYGRLDPSSPTVIPDALAPLVDEVVTTLEYFKASNPGKGLGRVVLCGEGSTLPGLDQAVWNSMQVPVVRDLTWLRLPRAGLGIPDQRVFSLAPAMTAAVGLALGALS
jgi:type IV pilus assembly protein PilM